MFGHEAATNLLTVFPNSKFLNFSKTNKRIIHTMRRGFSFDNKQTIFNARAETLMTKPSFKDLQKKRCIVLSDGFYEWGRRKF